jgi:hypothetical protein
MLALGVAVIGCKRGDEASPSPHAERSDALPTQTQEDSGVAALPEAQTDAQPSASDVQDVAAAGHGQLPAPRLELIAAGEGEKRELRYVVAAESKQQLRLLITMSTQLSQEGSPKRPRAQPTIQLDLEVNAKTADDGNIRADFLFANATIEGGDKQRSEGMQRQLRMLEGLKAWVEVDPHGMVQSSGLDVPELFRESAKEQIGFMERTLQSLVVPFPAEPVGKNAQWKVVSTVIHQGARVEQELSYQLESADGNTGRVKLAITQSASAQAFAMGGLKADAKVELVSLSSSGKGAAEFDLQQLLSPMSSIADMTIILEMSNKQGAHQRMQLDSSLRIDVGTAG